MSHDKRDYLTSVEMLGASDGLNCPIYLCSVLTNVHGGGPHTGRRDKIQLERPSAEHHSISSELLEKNFLMSYLFKSGSHLRSSDHKSKSGLHTLTQIVFYYARIGETGFLITNMTNFNWIIKINHKKVTSFEAKPMITIYPSHHVMDYEYHTVVTTVLKT